MSKNKKTRARSVEAKEKQFQRIIKAGRELFLKHGPEGVSMRKLANKLNMGQASLYTYISSKRELWFAILRNDFGKFELGMAEIMQDHKGNYKELLEKIAQFYLDFAREDEKRYKMMFQTQAPQAERTGLLEQQYDSKSIYYLNEIVQKAVDAGEIKEKDVGKLSFFIWGIVH
ncbi:MAG: TetR/AcrR family transcriptional regulator, partial [Candidatus Heimdallarchaeaceae archaeon]